MNVEELMNEHAMDPRAHNPPFNETKNNAKGPPYSVYGFPRIVSTYAESKTRPVELYTRSLLLEGHGYPIYYPYQILNPKVPSIYKSTTIGDVGVATLRGNFKWLFNIFLPADHPSQMRPPAGFEPFSPAPTDSDVLVTPNYHPPGTIITSPNVNVDVRSKAPWDITFTSDEIQAGMLILQQGANRRDLISSERYHEYIAKNARHWYQVANGLGEATYPNGSLLFVTGNDTCDAFSLVAYAREPEAEPMNIRFTQAIDQTPGRFIDQYSSISHVQWPYPDSRKYTAAEPPHTVFVRGLRISLSGQEWRNTIHPLGFSPKNRHFTFTSSKPSKLDLWSEKMKVRLRVRQSALEIKGDVHPGYECMFHPSFILGQILHGQFPDAAIAIIDDSVWCSLVDKRQLCTLSEINKLIVRVLAACNVVEHNGTLMLVLKSRVVQGAVKGKILPTPPSWTLRQLGKDWVSRCSLFDM